MYLTAGLSLLLLRYGVSLNGDLRPVFFRKFESCTRPEFLFENIARRLVKQIWYNFKS